ncbi:EAL domain-containing protein [Klebsiella sp. CTHL.F3a]|uniref:EAL domain-containing protein n=1 Tax=Klebsiella sp. CTHL.F3a TaxID=2873296 RepID=UPI001CA70D9B|nr:EAL domain-containing protein [Klebsiella sp. CTHL.F3a]QZY80900.1 EAL domain-containing protein [Klebsiella sp. CTHL.F3a]
MNNDKNEDCCRDSRWGIISPCNYAASGLSHLLKSVFEKESVSVVINEDTDISEILLKMTNSEVNSYMVYLPDEPFYFLLVLRIIITADKYYCPQSKFIFVSGVSCFWVRQNILHMSEGSFDHFVTKVISSKLGVKRLGMYIERTELNLPYEVREYYIAEKSGIDTPALTLREAEALIDYFSLPGSTLVPRNSQVAPKTLYNQRKSGLKKMVENSAELARRLSGASRRWKAAIAPDELSSGEKEFIAGIEMQEVYPVFQPIVDTSRQICGVEILTRWCQKGKNIPPETFIPELKSESVLLLLTAMGLKNAIDGINRYDGKVFFSVNIHSKLAGCSGLIRMCAEACRQIKNMQWRNRLVLEYSEKSDFHKSHDIIDVLESISTLGVTLYLDDCFSEGSVFFPVRKYSFDGYKLDKSIVDNILTSKEDMALITSLAGYCSMTGRHCIAEGVEDMFTFEKLKKLGIELFQGYLFYKPVSITDLTSLIQGSKCADSLKHTDIS